MIKLKFTITSLLLLCICISCKQKKVEKKMENQITWDTILKKKGYFFGNKILYTLETKYTENNPKITTYYIDINHQKILEYEDNAVLIKDTIYDINNDGLKDFVLLYQTTGPILHHIYLLNKNGVVTKEIETYNYFPLKNGEFIEAINFRSPIVRMKKMKWIGNTIDTIEKVNFNLHENSTYYKLINGKDPFLGIDPSCNNCDADKYDKSVKTIKLKTLPEDYLQALKKYYPEFKNE